ncbi:patatin-like phospholipase family protein [Legionella cardiaca]|uniref:Patatin-like phospholipase family protein n=1 Tax=Legionella cardiaca TaxID=1071983 RepID=A0ABY8AZS4_9GAMM|nr:patatin-like phospholipase family protein [Legionella cardiaca]WED44622.1 patatin-like phospholipase family protein [Legionella cardiaca]
MKQTGIVLQGGGALGAYELGVLKRLYEQEKFSPNIVAGVSIGAINAVALIGAKNDPIKTLEAMWDEFTLFSTPLSENIESYLALFGNDSFFNLRTDYWALPYWTSFYFTQPLQQLLLKYIDFEKINNSPIHLILTATDIETGEIKIFENKGKNRTEITPLHVLASGSLPPGFPMTTIGNKNFWDGGLFENTPLSPVLERLNPNPAVEKQIIVVNLFPCRGKIPTNMIEVFDRVFEIIFSNKIRFNLELTAKVNDYIEVINEIEKLIPENSAIKKLPGYKRLINYKYIQNIIYIENEDPESVAAPFDFSRKSIQKRIEAGYRDAGSACL